MRRGARQGDKEGKGRKKKKNIDDKNGSKAVL